MGSANGALALFFVIHLVGVAVVGGDKQRAVESFGCSFNLTDALIEGFHGNDYRIQVSCVAYHVAVWKIAAEEIVISAFHGGNQFLGNFLAFHSGLLVKGDEVGGNFFPGFQCFIKFCAAVAVPEVGHMTVFLSFG